MVTEAPPFWWKKNDWRAWALSPFSLIYGYFAARNLRRAPRVELDVAVICVGNFTAGGAGKTPSVIALAQSAIEMGLKPGILSRGYGGGIDRTTLVDPAHHRARDVGDEPLLEAMVAPTVIARKRLDGAQLLIEQGIDLIIMDDGFQSAKIMPDHALMVVDTYRGIGNGFMLPAGPVRAPTDLQLSYATSLLKVGQGNAADPFIRAVARSGKPVYEASIKPRVTQTISDRRVLAFAGIADPVKFHRTLGELGAEIIKVRNFPDHHLLDEDEIKDLLNTAEREDLLLVTTQKDHVRLRGEGELALKLQEKSHTIEVEMVFDNPATPKQIILNAQKCFHQRRFKIKN